MNVSTANIDKSKECLAWLRSHNAKGLDQITFKYSSDAGGSLGCYAAKDFQKGDLIFAIPQKCLFGIENTRNTELANLLRKSAAELGNSKLLTSELLIWLHMCQQLADAESMFYPYFKSLDKQPPNLDNWSAELKSAFEGTSLAASIAENALQNSVDTHVTLVEHALQQSTTYNTKDFDATSLHWARGHYLSRRYPGKYAAQHSVLSESEQSTDGREYGMQNLGIMVPLLDILNHDASREWLQFEVRDEALQVICNHPREKGQELYSNYGALSNEVLLYAYGFAISNNPFDTVSFKLKNSAGNSSGSGCSSSSDSCEAQSFSITAGGISGVPKELWGALSVVLGTSEDIDQQSIEDDGPAEIGMDECDALLQYLERKLQSLDETEPRVQKLMTKYSNATRITAAKKRKLNSAAPVTTGTNTTNSAPTITNNSTEHIQYIQYYRQGQCAIMRELAQELQDILESAGSEEEEEEEEGEEENDEDGVNEEE